jgi:hypothetical protein
MDNMGTVYLLSPLEQSLKWRPLSWFPLRNFWLARLVERNSCFAYLACTRRTEEGMIQGFLDVSFFSCQKLIEHKNLKKKVFGFVW